MSLKKHFHDLSIKTQELLQAINSFEGATSANNVKLFEQLWTVNPTDAYEFVYAGLSELPITSTKIMDAGFMARFLINVSNQGSDVALQSGIDPLPLPEAAHLLSKLAWFYKMGEVTELKIRTFTNHMSHFLDSDSRFELCKLACSVVYGQPNRVSPESASQVYNMIRVLDEKHTETVVRLVDYFYQQPPVGKNTSSGLISLPHLAYLDILLYEHPIAFLHALYSIGFSGVASHDRVVRMTGVGTMLYNWHKYNNTPPSSGKKINAIFEVLDVAIDAGQDSRLQFSDTHFAGDLLYTVSAYDYRLIQLVYNQFMQVKPNFIESLLDAIERMNDTYALPFKTYALIVMKKLDPVS